MRATYIRKPQRQAFQERLHSFEKSFNYPLGGDDRFIIDHGEDYFAFFDRLGERSLIICLEDGSQIVGCLALVLRKVAGQRTWYICDLKISPEYQGKGHLRSLQQKAFLLGFPRCQRAYGVSMNPNTEAEGSRVQTVSPKIKLTPFPAVATLSIFQVSGGDIERVVQTLKHSSQEGFPCVVDNAGIKQFFHATTGAPIVMPHLILSPLKATLHAPLTPWAQHRAKPHATYAFSLPESDRRIQRLAEHGVHPKTSASVLAYRMPRDTDWSFISTADI